MNKPNKSGFIEVRRDHGGVEISEQPGLIKDQPGLEVNYSEPYLHNQPSEGVAVTHSPPAIRGSRLWWIIAPIATVLIAGLAAGLGGGLAVRNAKRSCDASLANLQPTPESSGALTDSSMTFSSTPTGSPSSTLSLAPTSGIFWGGAIKTSIPLPSTENHRYDSRTGVSFDTFYNKDSAGFDVMGLLVDTFEICLEACANWDMYRNNNNSTCAGAAWVPAWINGRVKSDGDPMKGNADNCFIKTLVSSPTQIPADATATSLMPMWAATRV